MLITILATVVVLGVLIFVHELGHFLTAKAVDIEVPRFSIGLGPKLIGFKRGETEYVISWLPLGGYVKMAGMEEMEKLEGGSDKPIVSGALTADDTGIEVETPRQAGPRDFESKSLPARALVISAGVIMNILFAVVVFAISAMIWGVQAIPDTTVGNVTEEYLPRGTEALARLPVGARITAVNNDAVGDARDVRAAIAKAGSGPILFEFEEAPPVTVQLPAGDSAKTALMSAFEPAVQTAPIIGRVVAGTAAARAGLEFGDIVRTANSEPMQTWQQFVAVVERNPGKEIPLEILRDGIPLRVTVIPDVKDLNGRLQYGRLGVYPKDSPASFLPRTDPGFFGSISHGVNETWKMVTMTAGFVTDLFTGNADPRSVGGPIQIGQLSGQVVRDGPESFLGFMALFSVNLAVLNLLPIPVLDGGHLMFLGYEAIRRRPLSLQQRMRFSQVGFVIVLAIMVWAVANDVLRLFGL
ncbi:MAG: RIP metalloprotease RseP [Gemmatimonadota bacterium]